MDEKKLTLQGHLKELRRALIISCLAVLVGVVVSVSFWDLLHKAILWPIRGLLPPGSKPVYLGVFDPIFYMFKLGLIGGLILASPIVFSQLWWFISPGLLPRERRMALPFILSATVCFLGGVAFCYFVVLPNAAAFSLGLMGEQTSMLLSVNQYLGNAGMFLLVFGIVFLTPDLVFLVAVLGLVHPRTMARFRKYVLLACFVIGAVLTPTPDIVNQAIMAVPMYVLYEVGLLIAWIFVRRREARAAREQP